MRDQGGVTAVSGFHFCLRGWIELINGVNGNTMCRRGGYKKCKFGAPEVTNEGVAGNTV